MPPARPKQYFAATQRAVANPDAIEWEELPSLAASLAQRLVQCGSSGLNAAQRPGANDSAFGSAGGGTAWDATMPATLDSAPVSRPFREPLPGLAAREVLEPGVFQHFFGSSPA